MQKVISYWFNLLKIPWCDFCCFNICFRGLQWICFNALMSMGNILFGMKTVWASLSTTISLHIISYGKGFISYQNGSMLHTCEDCKKGKWLTLRRITNGSPIISSLSPTIKLSTLLLFHSQTTLSSCMERKGKFKMLRLCPSVCPTALSYSQPMPTTILWTFNHGQNCCLRIVFAILSGTKMDWSLPVPMINPLCNIHHSQSLSQNVEVEE